MDGFTHFDEHGNAIMADVSEKKSTARQAVAEGKIKMSRACYDAVCGGSVKKGDVLGVARIAGIMAVKQTPAIIPLCHTLLIEKASVNFCHGNDSGNLANSGDFQVITATCTVKTTGVTGVEMEALTGVSAALLTIYDMCKALDKNMEITDIRLLEKSGGKSGLYHRPGARVELL